MYFSIVNSLKLTKSQETNEKRRDTRMAKLLNKMLNLVGWEAEEEDEEFDDEETEGMHDDVRGSSYQTPQYSQSFAKKSQQGKVVNIHSNNQFKVVIMQPETFDDAREKGGMRKGHVGKPNQYVLKICGTFLIPGCIFNMRLF